MFIILSKGILCQILINEQIVPSNNINNNHLLNKNIL